MSFHQRLGNLERRLRPLADDGRAAIHAAMEAILSDVQTFDTAATFARHVEAHGHDEDSIPFADALAARLEGRCL